MKRAIINEMKQTPSKPLESYTHYMQNKLYTEAPELNLLEKIDLHLWMLSGGIEFPGLGEEIKEEGEKYKMNTWEQDKTTAFEKYERIHRVVDFLTEFRDNPISFMWNKFRLILNSMGKLFVVILLRFMGSLIFFLYLSGEKYDNTQSWDVVLMDANDMNGFEDKLRDALLLINWKKETDAMVEWTTT